MCNNVNKVVVDAKSGFYDNFHPVFDPENEMQYKSAIHSVALDPIDFHCMH